MANAGPPPGLENEVDSSTSLLVNGNSSFQEELSSIMKNRLDEARETRDALLNRLKQLNNLVSKKFEKAPRRPPRSEDEINRRIRDIEMHMQVTSISAQEERDALREIGYLKSEKASIDDYSAFNQNLDALKSERAQIHRQLDENKDALRELQAAVKRVATVDRVKALCPGVTILPDELIEEEIQVPKDVAGRIIGKGGSMIQQLEQQSGALIDIESSKTAEVVPVRITGLPSAIKLAREAINDMANEESRTIPLSSAVAAFLLENKGEAVRQLEEKFNVRIRVLRSTQSAVISGAPRRIDSVSNDLSEIQQRASTLTLPMQVLPGVIGKKGSGFRAIQEAYGVTLDVEKDPTSMTATIAVIGADSVKQQEAIQQLSQSVEENTEKEIELEVEPVFVSYILEDKGEKMRDLMKNCQVYARAERDSECPKGAVIKLKGISASLKNAKDLIHKMQEEFAMKFVRRTTSVVKARVLIGQSGSTIEKLRQDYDVSIDIVLGSENSRGRRNNDVGAVQPGSAVILIRGDPEPLAQATDAVDSILNAFTEETLTVSNYVISCLIARGGELINEIQKESTASIDVTKGDLKNSKSTEPATTSKRRGRSDDELRHDGTISISGTDEQVAAAKARIENVIEKNCEEIIEFPVADAIANFIGRGGRNIKETQEKFPGVRLDASSANEVVFVRGAREAIEPAAKYVREFAERYIRENASIKVDKDMFPTLIGKKGANAKRLSEETGCEFDFDKHTGVVRIHGDEDKLENAIAKIKEAAGLDKHSEEIPIDSSDESLGAFIGKGGSNLRQLEQDYNVVITVKRKSNVVRVRGDLEDVARAKNVIRKQLRQAMRTTINVDVPTAQLSLVIGRAGLQVRALRESTGCQIDIPPRNKVVGPTASVQVRGTPEAVQIVRTSIQAIARGTIVRLIPLLTQHLKELQDSGARNVERIALENNIDIQISSSIAAADAFSEDDDASLDTGCVSVMGSSEGDVQKAVSAIERLLAFKFNEAFLLLDAPFPFIEEVTNDNTTPEVKQSTSLPVGAIPDDENDTSVVDTHRNKRCPTLHEIHETTGVHIYANRDASHLVLAGPTAIAVQSAKDILMPLIEFWNSRCALVEIDSSIVPAFVGKKGAGIKALEKKVKCKINVEKSATSASVSIFADDEESAAAAEKIVRERVAELIGKFVELTVGVGGFGAILGQGGKKASEIQEQTGASIELNRDRSVVVIRASTQDAVDAGREQVEKILFEAGVDCYEGPPKEESMDVERSVVFAIIGKGGAQIRQLQQASGASITVDRETSEVLITGSADAVAKAKQLISETIDKAQQSDERPAAETTHREHTNGDIKPSNEKASKPAQTPNVLPEVKLPVVPVGAAPEDKKRFLAAAKTKSRKPEEQIAQYDVELQPENEVDTSADNVLKNLLASTNSSSSTPATVPPIAVSPSFSPSPTSRQVRAPPGFDSPAVTDPSLSTMRPENGKDVDPMQLLSSILAPTNASATSTSHNTSELNGTAQTDQQYYKSSSGVSIRL